MRALIIQAAQNAMDQKASPLHRWGWKIAMKGGSRNIAAAAVGRKLVTAVWHLLSGHFTPLLELDAHLGPNSTKSRPCWARIACAPTDTRTARALCNPPSNHCAEPIPVPPQPGALRPPLPQGIYRFRPYRQA